MADHTLPRRTFIGAAATGALTLATAPARAAPTDDFQFEITRSEDEWRAMLSDHEYNILRNGGTEDPQSSPYHDFEEQGTYHCKGCDLPVYQSNYKVNWPKKGWVFFFHSLPNNVLFGIDKHRPAAYGAASMGGPAGDLIESHCRRCGSHLGHVLMINLFVIHCTNGAAFTFKPAEA